MNVNYPQEGRDLLFPPEAVTEILYKGEWLEVKSGTFKEFMMDNVTFVQFVDPTDNTIVFLLDRLIEGWKLDPRLVVLVKEDENNSLPSGD